MNYLLPSLGTFLKEVTGMKKHIQIIKSFTENFKRSLLDKEYYERELLGGVIYFRDLSELHNSSNLIIPQYGYKLIVSSLEKDVDFLLNQQYTFLLSRSYEAFETFLYDIYGSLLVHNPHFIDFLDIKGVNHSSSEIVIRDGLKNARIKGKRANDKFIYATRKLSPHFALHENNNSADINIVDWLVLFTEVRHCAVHGRLKVSQKMNSLILEERYKTIFDKYFTKQSVYNVDLVLVDWSRFDMNFTLLNGIAYFIFKSLSIELDLKLDLTG